MEDKNILEQKQKYLREEILDKSYDIDEFSDFMSKYKENGTDLQNWEFIELKEAVNSFKNQVNENKVEKGVEKIRQSFVFNEEQKNPDEYLDINLDLINNNLNNDNNCVNNILNDYLKNKKNDEIKIKKEKKNSESYMDSNNTNQKINEKNNIINKENNNNGQLNSNDSSHINFESDNSKKESQEFNIQGINNNPKNNEHNSKKNDNDILLAKFKTDNINNNLSENIINNQNQYNNISKQKEFNDFEILDNLHINNKEFEKIKCVKQSENSLTNKDNLYINLEA